MSVWRLGLSCSESQAEVLLIRKICFGLWQSDGKVDQRVQVAVKVARKAEHIQVSLSGLAYEKSQE